MVVPRTVVVGLDAFEKIGVGAPAGLARTVQAHEVPPVDDAFRAIGENWQIL